jgi:hypothetical protein
MRRENYRYLGMRNLSCAARMMRVIGKDLRGCKQTKLTQYPLETKMGELRRTLN